MHACILHACIVQPARSATNPWLLTLTTRQAWADFKIKHNGCVQLSMTMPSIGSVSEGNRLWNLIKNCMKISWDCDPMRLHSMCSYHLNPYFIIHEKPTCALIFILTWPCVDVVIDTLYCNIEAYRNDPCVFLQKKSKISGSTLLSDLTWRGG